MGAHDEDGCDLDFAGLRDWLAEYDGEELSCALRAPMQERLTSSAFYFGGRVDSSRGGPPRENWIRLDLGRGSMELLASDFVSAQAHYESDTEIHALSVRFQGFALLVSAGPPSAR